MKSGVQSTCFGASAESAHGKQIRLQLRMLSQLLCCSLHPGSGVTLTATAGLSSVAEHEDALLRHLFQGYQKWVRPVLNSSDTMKVYFGLKISQLVDVVSDTWLCSQSNTSSLTVVTLDFCLSLFLTLTFYK